MVQRQMRHSDSRITLQKCAHVIGDAQRRVGAVGIEIASLIYKSFKRNGVAPPPKFNWRLLEPS